MSEEHYFYYRRYTLYTAPQKHYLLLKQNRADFDVWEEAM